MRIIGDINGMAGIALFWRRAGSPARATQFHADMHLWPAETLHDVASRFEAMFPGDRVASIRDRTGRFQSYRK